MSANNAFENYKKLLEIVKRTAASSCYLRCNACLSCDAKSLLRELGEEQ